MLTENVLVVLLAAHGNHAIRTQAPLSIEKARRSVGGGGVDVGDVMQGTKRFFIFDPRRRLSAFPDVNMFAFLLVARRDDGDHFYRATYEVSPVTNLTNDDAIAFIAGSPERALIEERLRSLNASPEPEEMARAIAATSISQATRDAWRDIYDAHRNAKRTLEFTMRHVGQRSDMPIHTDIAGARARLEKALDAMIARAIADKLDGWIGGFRAARAALDATEPDNPSPARELADAGLAPAAVQLFDAATKADVFGGMGSLNDTHESTESNELHAAITPSLEAAINAEP
jgi:hypothetical protein